MPYFNYNQFSHKSDFNCITAYTISLLHWCYSNIRHTVDVGCQVWGRFRSQSDPYVSFWVNCK
jgi:hypothetical protein